MASNFNSTAFNSTARLDLAAAKEHLRSHHITALFIETLGWQPAAASPIASQDPIQKLDQLCSAIAYRDGVTAWQVLLTAEMRFTPTARQSIYKTISQQTSSLGLQKAPLVVFVDARKTRSFWCSAQESALYVTGQPIAVWEFRLKQLARSQNLSSVLDREKAEAKYETFEKLLQGLYDGISGVSHKLDRRDYALLTLQRLIFIQSMQQKGWLGGDTWYMQSRFGATMQSGENLFFGGCLQPLYRSLALPKIERSPALKAAVGNVPFLGWLFDIHKLERKYEQISIDDGCFEEILGWLSEQSSDDALNPWLSGDLGYLLECYWAQQAQPKSDYVGASALAQGVSDHTIDSLLLSRINHVWMPAFFTGESSEAATLNDLLFSANARLCRHLIQDILPELRILDPACGSGSLLVALHQRLVEIFSILTGYIQQSKDTQLKIWRNGLVNAEAAQGRNDAEAENNSLLLNVQARVLKNNLYGVDILPGAVETARLQQWLMMVAIAQQPNALEPLPDLSFNLLVGNSLVGLVSVDEERFDQVNQAGELGIFQGNLLQPLAADGYQTILAERNLSLEHYKSRNQTLAKASNIPAYARAALLKEEILELDSKAQSKLDALLLNYMSQQLGIQYKAMQLDDKPHRRLLTIEDIDVLQPFHWGYHFNPIIRRGGFDAIVCVPPWGAFKPTTEGFFQRFQDLAEAKGLSVEASAKLLKTSKQALAEGDPEIAQAWLFYQNQYAYVADYFYRSEQYAHQNLKVRGKSVRNQLALERLFLERCCHLLCDDGMATVVLPGKLSGDDKAQALLCYLQEIGRVSEVEAGQGSRLVQPSQGKITLLLLQSTI